MAIYKTYYVNTGSTAGGDGTTNGTAGATRAFASLSEFDATAGENLVTAASGHVIVYLDNSGGDDTTACTLSNFTVDASNHIILVVASGSRHDGTPGSGYRINVNASSAAALDIQLANTVVDGLEVVNTGFNQAKGFDCAAADIVLANCIGRASSGGTSTNAAAFFFTTDGATAVNCLGWGGTRGFRIQNFIDANFYNCTAANNDNEGFVRAGTGGTPKPILQNCVAFGNGTAFANGASTSYWDQTNSSHNASDDANTTAIPGQTGGSLVSGIVAGDFADEANDDYTLSSGASALVDVGTDLTTEFSALDVGTDWICDETDGAGNNRGATWDIGFSEYVAAGDTTVLVPAADIAIAALAPTISTGASVGVPVADISIAALAPTISASISTTVLVPVADIAIAALAPSIRTGASVAVPVADIALAGLAPTISTGVSVAVPAADISIAALVPSIVIGEAISVDVLGLSSVTTRYTIAS